MIRFGLLAAMAAAGCSGSTSANPCTFDGTYSYVSKRAGGTCGALPGDNGDPSTLSIQSTNGTPELIFGGLTGGCPARVNGCKLDAACTISASGSTLGTGQLALTFTASGATGSEDDVITQALPAVPGSPCKASYTVTATRK